MIRKQMITFSVLLLLAVSTPGQTQDVQHRQMQLEPLFDQTGRRYGLDARILKMICFVESRYRRSAVSPKGAQGLMQFMPETAARYGLRNPNDPKAAIDDAARYLRDLLKRYGGRIDLALAAYNAGEGTVDSFITGKPLLLKGGKIINPRGAITGGIPPYSETRAYVKTIIAPLLRNRMIRLPSMAATITKTQSPIRSRNYSLDVTQNSDRVDSKNAPSSNSSFIAIP
jgi:soluble lytic murein transglycosylase-like protein